MVGRPLAAAAIALGTLFASTAAACPRIAGSYLCIDGSERQEELHISQEVRGGVTTFTFADFPGSPGGTVAADGRTYQMPDTDVVRGSTLTAQCDGDSFEIVQRFSMMDEELTVQFDISVEMSLSDGALLQVARGTMKKGEVESPLSSTIRCDALAAVPG